MKKIWSIYAIENLKTEYPVYDFACKPKFLLILILAINITGFLHSQSVTPQTQSNLPLYHEGKLYLALKVNSSVLIQNKDTIQNDPNSNFGNLFAKYQVTSTRRPFIYSQNPGLLKIYLVSFNQPAKVDSFIMELSAISGEVKYAERVPIDYPGIVPNELSPNPTPQAPNLYHLALLNANLASNIYTSSASAPGTAPIAVIDDAVLTSHEDLLNNIGALNADMRPTATNSTNPNPPLASGNASVLTHGSLVAGIAGAVTNNSLGVAAVGWNNKLMGVRCAELPVPGGLVDITYGYQGIDWAVANGARVINMSWGSSAASQTNYTVITSAKNAGVVLVASAGNNFVNTPCYPAAYGEGTTGQPWEIIDRRLVIAVSSLDQNSNVSIWPGSAGSNFGSWVDISAYGTGIISTKAASTSSGTAINNQYLPASGTSFAAPMIAGIAGLMRSYNSSKSVDEIYDCLIGTANPDIYGNTHPLNQIGALGSGRADAAAALRCVSATCSVNPIVVIAPSSQNLCAGGTISLSATSSASSYTWSTGANTSSIVVSTPGTYSVLASYPGNCTATASIVILPPPTLSISASTNTSICPGSSIAVLSASGNFTSVIWQPFGLTTNSIATNPSTPVVYTITANPSCGGTTVVFSVNPSPFTQPLSSNVPYSILSGSLAGQYYGYNNLTPTITSMRGKFLIPSNVSVNQWTSFLESDVIISPSVNITVSNGGNLIVNLTHFYGCPADMWQGIVLNDGAELSLINKAFIEDAVTAITSTHIPIISSGFPPAKITLNFATFNKNFIDVALSNYYDQISPSSYNSSLKVDNCVFTCRDFSTVYPSPGNGPLSPAFRTVFSSTTGLAAPYTMYGHTVTTLKSPYVGQISRCAFLFSNTTPTNNAITSELVIGDDSDPTFFNLFDNHEVFINAQNCNVTLKNNVFQNQRHATVVPQNVSINIYPGQINSGWSNNSAAVMHRTFSAALNTTLNMSAANYNVGNRFWDCIRAVEAFNTHTFKMSYGIARSTHTVDGTNIVGTSGLNLKTNRVNYEINHNEFTNIKNAINVPLTAGYIAGTLLSPNSPPVVTYGNNLIALDIFSNRFSAGNISIGNFMNQAINVTNDLNVWPNSPTPLPQLEAVLPSYGWMLDPVVFPNSFKPTGLGVIHNEVVGAYNGINVSGIAGFPVWLANNSLTLAANPPTTQYGIQFTNGTSTAPKQQSVWLNKVTGFGTANPLVSLIFCSSNSGNTSPLINCNTVKNANKGFVFSGNNIGAQNVLGTQWLGNNMENLQYGMFLEGTLTTQSVMISGVIGQQGSSVVAMGNSWAGSTWSLPNYNIWTQNSTASLSPVYHFGSWSGMSLSGLPIPLNYSWPNSGVYAIKTTTNLNFYCDWTQNFVEPDPEPIDPVFDGLQAYLSNVQTYHFLRYNQAIRDNGSGWDDWYDDLQSNSNLETMELTQEALYSGDYAEARSHLTEITAQNYVEENSMAFYDLYADYLEYMAEGSTFTSDDSLALVQIAQLCPIEYGACVYKARALYNTIYSYIIDYPGCSELTEEGRAASGIQDQTVNSNAYLYPNPVVNSLVIRSTKANDELSIQIFDITGREVLLNRVVTKDFSGVLNFDLPNGIYVAKITNSGGSTDTKKLLIAK